MKSLFFILTLFISIFVTAQTKWTFTPIKERLYNEIAKYNSVDILGFSESDEDPFLWKQADSFFRDMPLKVALSYYNDKSYPIRCYSFLKILGITDSIAFSLFHQYILDSTEVLCTVGDDIPFNKFLTHQYDLFIDSKYYWCDTLHLWRRNYFREKAFVFSKVNYKNWFGDAFFYCYGIRHTFWLQQITTRRTIKS